MKRRGINSGENARGYIDDLYPFEKRGVVVGFGEDAVVLAEDEKNHWSFSFGDVIEVECFRCRNPKMYSTENDKWFCPKCDL